MITGLILGKFMPPHIGHLALIRFALKRCDKLIVVVCSRPGQPISEKLRYKWMNELTEDYPKIKLEQIRANLPVDKEKGYRASEYWANYCIKRFGKIDRIFSSETYGPLMAKYMKAKSFVFDFKRTKFPVSASLIRESPYKYWKYIPGIIRSYYIDNAVS